jgi:hypothetical protein
MFELAFGLTISLSHNFISEFFLINCINFLYLIFFLSYLSFCLYINAFNCLNEENKGSQIISLPLSRFNFFLSSHVFFLYINVRQLNIGILFVVYFIVLMKKTKGFQILSFSLYFSFYLFLLSVYILNVRQLKCRGFIWNAFN